MKQTRSGVRLRWQLLQNHPWLVGGGLAVLGGEDADSGDEGIDLFGGVAGVAAVGGEEVGEVGGGEAEAGVGGEAGEEVVLTDLAGTQVFDGGDGVLFDGFVRGLAASAFFDGFHHDGGCEEERQITKEFLFDDGVEDFHLMEDGEEGFEEAVGGEEGVWKHDAADDGAGDVAFIPLVAGEAGGHG